MRVLGQKKTKWGSAKPPPLPRPPACLGLRAYLALAKHPLAPVVKISTQSKSVSVFSTNRIQVLSSMFCIP